MRSLTGTDDRVVIAYFRNEGENVKIGKEWHSGWVRKPTPARFDLQVRLPGTYEGFLHTFDENTRQDVRIDGEGQIGNRESTTRDYWLYLQRV